MSPVELTVRILLFFISAYFVVRRILIHRKRPLGETEKEKAIWRAEAIQMRGMKVFACSFVFVALFTDSLASWGRYPLIAAVIFGVGLVGYGSYRRTYLERSSWE